MTPRPEEDTPPFTTHVDAAMGGRDGGGARPSQGDVHFTEFPYTYHFCSLQDGALIEGKRQECACATEARLTREMHDLLDGADEDVAHTDARDAARYRTLRDNPFGLRLIDGNASLPDANFAKRMDALLDTARAEAPGGEGQGNAGHETPAESDNGL